MAWSLKGRHIHSRNADGRYDIAATDLHTTSTIALTATYSKPTRFERNRPSTHISPGRFTPVARPARNSRKPPAAHSSMA
jgi:hypothetical protein